MTDPELRVDRAFADETNRLTAERFPVGAAAFALVFAIAWVMESQAHPTRLLPYAMVYAVELLLLVVAGTLIRHPAFQRRSEVIAVAAVALIEVLVASYHAMVGGEGDVLLLALTCISIGAMVLLPWGWRGQAVVVLTSVGAYLLASRTGLNTPTPMPMTLLGLVTIGVLSIWAADYLWRHRRQVFDHTRALQTANDALAAANETKNQFVAAVSHELRTPLTIIVGYTDLVLEEHYGPVSDELRPIIERIAHNGRTLVYLLSDLVDLARIESRKLAVHLTRVELTHVFADVVPFMGPLLEAKPVNFRCEPPGDLAVTADRQRVEQILVNLLTNAAKFTEQGEIRLGAHRDGAGTVLVEVSDTGVGIDPSEVPKLFQPFAQGAAGRRFGGTGVGLSLSAQLAQAMGGTITVRSSPRRGSTFTVTLPAA